MHGMLTLSSKKGMEAKLIDVGVFSTGTLKYSQKHLVS
jgi:hypothetical protein